MKFIKYGFVTLLLLCGNVIFAQLLTITLAVNNLKNTKGVCRVFLFKSAEGFPLKTTAADCKVIKIDNDTVRVVFEKITPGTYAIAVFHDENEDGKLNTNFWGEPKEGTGISRNIKHGFSLPKFDEAKFTVDENSLAVSINMNYF